MLLKKTQQPIVAHIKPAFFEKSETFIHNYLSNSKTFKPVCLALDYVNLDVFPFPKNDLYYFPKSRLIDFRLGARMVKGCEKEEIIKDLPVRLIHAHFGQNGFYCLALKRKYGLPLVTTFYDFDASKLPRKKKWQRNYKVLFKEGDLFLVEGKYMGSRLVELGCPENKIQIQRIAIPFDKISAIERKNEKKDKAILVFSGRFVEKKGLIYILRAINKIKSANRDFEFHIIGDGPLKKDIEKFIQENELTNLVKMLGFLNYEDYLAKMAEADIFVHPSVTAADGDSEGGAPTTILEAQAMGLPVVATYHADIPNIVVPNQSALLSKEKDVDALAQNIIFLLKNRDKWKGMGQVGREFIRAFHDIKCEVAKLEDKYNSLVQRPIAVTRHGGCSSAG